MEALTKVIFPKKIFLKSSLVIYSKELYSINDINRWIVHSCRGLQYLHENEIIHRDVKPPKYKPYYDIIHNLITTACFLINIKKY